MAQKFQVAVDALAEEIEAKLREVAELKRTANFLRSRDGEPPLFEDIEDPTIVKRGLAGIRPDQFYGRSPITAAREYLDLRGEAVQPDEIADALEKGGFDFKAQGWSSKSSWARNLAISMSKNSGIFHRLPNGYYGLVKFYPELGRKKRPIISVLDTEPEAIEEKEAQLEPEGEGSTPPTT